MASIETLTAQIHDAAPLRQKLGREVAEMQQPQPGCDISTPLIAYPVKRRWVKPER